MFSLEYQSSGKSIHFPYLFLIDLTLSNEGRQSAICGKTSPKELDVFIADPAIGRWSTKELHAVLNGITILVQRNRTLICWIVYDDPGPSVTQERCLKKILPFYKWQSTDQIYYK